MSHQMSHQTEVLKLEKTNLSRPEQTWANRPSETLLRSVPIRGDLSTCGTVRFSDLSKIDGRTRG